MLRSAVDMAAEGHPLLGQLAQFRKAHHLKPAGIGKDRALPVHEPVQPAQPVDPFCGRAKHQVIGVAQQDIGPGRPDAFGKHGLDGGRRAYGHEGGRANLAARRRYGAAAGLAVSGMQGKGKALGHGPRA
jgi:hypothetical protein